MQSNDDNGDSRLTLLHALHPAQMSFLERVQKDAGAVSVLPLPDDFTGCACSLDWAAKATAASTQPMNYRRHDRGSGFSADCLQQASGLMQAAMRIAGASD